MEICTYSIQLAKSPLCTALYCHTVLSSPLSLMMKRLASNRYAIHKAGRVMDGLSDRLRRLVGGLCPGSLTPSILWSIQPPSPPIASIHPPESTPVTPTSCLWPLIIALPLLAMCWESKGSHLSLIRMEPHHLVAPRTKSQSIAWQTEMDWDIHDPVPFREAPTLQRAAVTDK